MERDVNQRFRVGTGDEHATVDAKGSPVKLAIAEDIGDGLARSASPDELSKAPELGGVEGPLRLENELDSGRPDGVREKELGVETRAVRAARAEVVGGPPEDGLDGPRLRLGGVDRHDGDS